MSEQKVQYVDGQLYSYEIYKLVDQYDPVLKSPTQAFDFANPPVDPKYLAVSLIKTMAATGGIGLAAPQCGLSYRVFVMGAARGAGIACFNPEIIEQTGEEAFGDEGCLSFPGLFLKVKRKSDVKVRYQDMYGNTREETFSGLTARVFLHELDHLNGITFTTLVSPVKLNMAKDKVKSNLKKMKRHQEEQQAMLRIQQIQSELESLKKKDEPVKDGVFTLDTSKL